MSSIKIKAHEHKLTYMSHKMWYCDACKRGTKELQDSYSYRCTSCNFDICKECTQPIKTSKHAHKMAVTPAKTVYRSGKWYCDNCRTTSKSQGS